MQKQCLVHADNERETKNKQTTSHERNIYEIYAFELYRRRRRMGIGYLALSIMYCHLVDSSFLEHKGI